MTENEKIAAIDFAIAAEVLPMVSNKRILRKRKVSSRPKFWPLKAKPKL